MIVLFILWGKNHVCLRLAASANIDFVSSESGIKEKHAIKILKNKKAYFKKLKQNNIRIVEKFSYKCLKGFSRLTLAPKKEINEFIKIFKSY